MPIKYEDKEWDFADLVEHIKKTKPDIKSPGGYVKEIEESQKGGSLSGTILFAKLSMIKSRMAFEESEHPRDGGKFTSKSSSKKHKTIFEQIQSDSTFSPELKDRLKKLSDKVNSVKKSGSLAGIFLSARLRLAKTEIEQSLKVPTVEMALAWWKDLHNVSKMQHADDPNRLNDAESITFVTRTQTAQNLSKEDVARIALDYAFRHQDVDTTKLLGFDIHKDSKTWWNAWKITQRQHMYDPHQLFPQSLEFCSKTYDEMSPGERKTVDKLYDDKHSEEGGEAKSASANPQKFTGEQLGYVEGPTPKECGTCVWFVAPNVCNYKNIGMNKPVNAEQGCCNEWRDKLGLTMYGVNKEQPRPPFKCNTQGCGFEGKTFNDLMQHKMIMEHGEQFINNKHASGNIKIASMTFVSQSEDGQYAVYFLLQGDEVNGRGWGVTEESIPKYIHEFEGMPFVVTSNEVFKDSPYGRTYDHPSTEHLAYLGIMKSGTYDVNDMDLILAFQNRFRIGVLFDPFFKDGTWRVIVKKDEQFKDVPWPPFVSPAIYKLDSSQPDGAISRWKPLHLAGLDSRPAYGTVAILHGSCSGQYGHCEHQLKTASLGMQPLSACKFSEIMAKINSSTNRVAALNSGDFKNVQILNLDNKKKKGGMVQPNIEGFGNEKFQNKLRNLI